MKSKSGFTLVELVIVVAVISILTVIAVVSYGSMSSKADFAKAQTDIRSIQKAIDVYKIRTGAYPNTSGSWRQQSSSGDAFIPNLKPTYISQLPVDKVNSGLNSYSYRSDGADYKLLRQRDPSTPLSAVERQNNPLLDPTRTTTAWGYWTPGAASW